jgi:hypothetical protein
MQLTSLRNQLKISIGLLLLFSATAFADTTNYNFDVEKNGRLKIRTDVGSIKIATHEKKTIELELRVEGQNSDKFKFSHEQNKQGVNLIGEYDNGSNWNNRILVEFILTIPKQYNLNIDTSGGSISIEDLIGSIEANTSGGSIRVGNIKGNVELDTSGGSITTETIEGEINAHTSGGSINVTIEKQPTKDAKFSTSGGSITAKLKSDIKISIDASTSGGRVSTDFTVDGKIRDNSIRGEINGGGPKLTLSTSGGSVRVRSL